ncbi:hypothetical protein [Alienimonas californiensis]|uniref:(Na+)-NQR maturation NqrM n=1 Tax=Alienimonas californiensis TaxID=2527989 RepID=A0A517P9N9_9PLAN|nr:hypothetical protein [Alienimonas californiensis]QDT16091.1 hypothetical protein CA12_21890 [Alienimonas californiensis]
MDFANLLPVILIAAVVIGAAVGLLALGTMLSGRRIQGSCGGLANSNIPGHDAKSPCMSCGASPESCDRPGAEDVREALQKEDAAR